MFAQENGMHAFVIDQSKPYVYLKFDHIGTRKPVRNGEGDIGLWLRVVNNCRISIVLRSFSMPPGISGVGLMDQVVENEPMLQTYSTPDEGQAIQRREDLRKLKHKPEGYMSETSGVVRIQPGTYTLFSVPLNHVDDDWHMRIEFTLDLDKSSITVGPFTYLSFYKWDIPKQLRPSEPAIK
jgi:hypothetical protein